ncbi:hypothetical protein EZV62_028292 [Acer yangbiense]|uniref:non-specific serine/threonine protein kinase n=1 Tax=Acer yangbiense TaxID=1000413 RepID=A0A5C7GP10_9ROSI|nr:hypothetical protein EZV62_028292 [Acer yangbiense]
MCRKNCLSEQTLNDQDVEALVKTYGSLAPKRYNYSDIKKMNNSFAVKLGQGGYGVVYRGRLNDGRIVAVKVLSKSKGNGEEFINEVACISRTSHVNIVGLLGFCYEGTRRALIYESMPNGSLDKFIKQGSLNTNLHLEWETLNQIVVGVARGLEYLHRGCNIRIVHFDIKLHNVLLDEDFCPKISDFGLAKICKKKESIISMLDARGTIGYTAPEVFCRNFGGVSHKSDVYGLGMMVLEIVGQIEGSNDLTVDGIINEEEEAIARKMILVSLWCIQTNPSDRPSMSKVVEMLEGSVQSLQVPPKPLLQHSSPRLFQLYSSTTSASLSRISSQQGFQKEVSLVQKGTTINHEILDYSDGYENVTFIYDCPPSFPRKYIPCSISNGVEHKNWSEAGDDDPGNCDASVFFPVPKNISLLHAIIDNSFLRQVLDQGFELKWKLSCENCTNSKGSCGWDPNRNETICFCPNQQRGLHHACRLGGFLRC